jgi:hypothetical protein
MNERIKELMAQAGTDTSGKWMGVDHAEKFAELIIEDCLQICNQGTSTQTTSGGAASMIRQHFGVE